MVKILIVDDNVIDRKFLSTILGKRGHRLLEAGDGAEALARARIERPDLVIADILMPTMDGYEFVRWLRVEPAIAATPVIFYTASYHYHKALALARSCGVRHFLMKPAADQLILDTVDAVLAASPASDSAEPPAEFDQEHLRLVTDQLADQVERMAQVNAQLNEEMQARRQSEETLRESEERLRLITENTSQVLWLASADASVILYVNPAYEAIWGRTRQSLYEHPTSWIEAVHADDRAAVRATLDHLIGGEPTTLPYRVVRPDGTVRRVLDHGFPVRDHAGRVYRLARDTEDVTERHQLEAQFRQAQKMEVVDRLASGVAHDFNNLLTIILGYSQIMLGRLPAADPWLPLLVEIQKAGERATGLTRQLLAFSRQQVLQPRVLDLNTVVTDMQQMLRRLFGEGIELAPGLHPVKADAGQIEQILMNLAVNARDAMPQGGQLLIETNNVTLDDTYARTHAEVAPGRYVLLAVSDTGCGIDERTQAQIFEPFFTTKEVGKGTGLGLATVYGIVKQSHGHIAVYSEPGQGAAFKVYLPVAPAAGEPVKAKSTILNNPRGSETILLAEDDDGLRLLIHETLRERGYRVLEARNGVEALQLREGHAGPVHLLLSDVVMPQMSGRPLAEHLAALRPDMKVLFMSGYPDDAVVRHGILCAEVHFIQKPFTPKALAQKVRELLDAPAAQ